MSSFVVESESNYINIPVEFIDQYMNDADEISLKVYLYFCRVIQSRVPMDFDEMSDDLHYTQQEILQAIQYWLDKHVIEIQKKHGTYHISLVDLFPAKDSHDGLSQLLKDCEQGKKSVQTSVATHKDQVVSDEDFKDVLYQASVYYGRELNNQEMKALSYISDTLQYSAEILEYLIELSVELGYYQSKNLSRFFESTAIAWKEHGYVSINDIKSGNKVYKERYMSVLSHLGYVSKSVNEDTKKIIDNWWDGWKFTKEMIMLACEKAKSQKKNATVQYVNGILDGWNKKKIYDPAQVKDDDMEWADKKSMQLQAKAKPTTRFNSFATADSGQQQFSEIQELLKYQPV